MNVPNPTAEECSRNAELRAPSPYSRAFACWYPQMGGYVGRAVVVIERERSADHVEDNRGGCFDVYVWHDGAFPFTGDSMDTDRPPYHLHHCDARQFIEFGRAVLKLQGVADDVEC